MDLIYNEIKTTQAAAYILQKRSGVEYYLKLIKLLYLADREAINRLGLPISQDRYVSMGKGPVLSITYDLISSEPNPENASYWHTYISEPSGYKVNLLNDPGVGQLSLAETEILDEIINTYGKFDRWALVHLTHHLPEYQDPGNSSIPISIEDILTAIKKTEEEKEQIRHKIEFAAGIESVFSGDCINN